MLIFSLVFLHKFVKIDSLVCNVLWALLISFETKSMSTLVHVHWA